MTDGTWRVKWTFEHTKDGIIRRCPMCNRTFPAQDGTHWKLCPVCGAKFECEAQTEGPSLELQIKMYNPQHRPNNN